MATEAEKKAIRSAAAKKAAETRRLNKIAAERRQETSSTWNWNWLGWILLAAVIIALLVWHPWTPGAAQTAAPTEAALAEVPTEAPIVAEVPTAAPTEAPAVVQQQPAAPTEAAPVDTKTVLVTTTNQTCPNTTEEAKAIFGVDVQRIDTEPCAWVWRGKPLHTTATCPSGYVCTWDVVGDITVVHLGINQQADIYAGTWRLISAYPADDAVNNVCELYLKEKDFASREVPSFEVRFQPVPDLGPQTCP